MIKKKIVILRVDGGTKLGYGHLFRAVTLTKKIRKINFKIFIEKDGNGFKFLKEKGLDVIQINKKNEFKNLKKINTDTIILDSIIISKKRIQRYRNNFKKLIIFEDLGNKGKNYANIIINSIVDGPKEKIEKIKYGKKFIGAKYKILNNRIKVSKKKKDKSAVISFGGGDYEQKTIYKIIKIIKILIELKFKPSIIYGPGITIKTMRIIQKKIPLIKIYKNQKEIYSILQKSFILFCAGGGTIYDGIINKCIIFYTPRNSHQRENIKKFMQIKCGFLLNKFDNHTLKNSITKVVINEKLIKKQIQNYKNIINENGIYKVKSLLINFIKKNKFS